MSNHIPSVKPFDAPLWKNPHNWPPDPPGYVFLPRALDEIGRAQYGLRWGEPEDPVEPPDEADDAVWTEYDRACDEYDRTCGKAKADFQSLRADVARTFVHECEVGNLVTAVRSKSGGAMVGLEACFWNLEAFWPRFSRCDMSLDDPFSKSRFHRSHWIYVTRDSLDKYLGKVPATDEGAELDKNQASSRADSGSTTQSGMPARRPAPKDEIARAAKKLYQRPGKPPNMAQAEKQLMIQFPGTSRDAFIRPVLRRKEFADLRLKPGNQAKR